MHITTHYCSLFQVESSPSYKKWRSSSTVYKKPRSEARSEPYMRDVLDDEPETEFEVNNEPDVVVEETPAPVTRRYRVYKSRPSMSRYAEDVAYERPIYARRYVRPARPYRPSRVQNSPDQPRGPTAVSSAQATDGIAASFAHTNGKQSYSTGFATSYPQVPDIQPELYAEERAPR